MASGKITTDESKKKLNLQPGTTHTEQELIFPTGDKVQVEVTTPDGVKTYDLNEDGIYLLNLKNDTLVGGAVNYSSGERTTRISGEDLDKMIDSTQQLIEGKNVSDEKKTYFVVPATIKKLGAVYDAKVIGPYNNIPRTAEKGSDGKPRETYKFFTNKQKRETLEDLKKNYR